VNWSRTVAVTANLQGGTTSSNVQDLLEARAGRDSGDVQEGRAVRVALVESVAQA
jgi:hypothetical protein